MATDLQKDLANALIVNAKLPRDKRKNKRDLLVSVGYATKVAKHKPKEIIEQKGVKEALREMGLTEKLITEALVDDIKKKPKNRIQELRLGAEILDMKNDDAKGGTTNNTLIIAPDQIERILRRNLASDSSGTAASNRFSDRNESEI